MKLNLGCGQNKLDGFINIDKFSSFEPDIVHDLEVFPWPFSDDSIEFIEMHHVLEHLGATTDVFLGIIKELYRICKPGAEISITVPHPRSDGYEGDPSHVRKINLAIMSLFSLRKNKEWADKGWPNTPFATYIGVNLEIKSYTIFLMPYWNERFNSGKISKDDLDFAINAYHNVVDSIKMEILVVK